MLDLQQLSLNALDLLYIKIVSKFFSLPQGKPIRLEECEIMFFQMFHRAIQLVKHASVLFDEEVQSSSVTGLQMISWFGKLTCSFRTPIRT